MRLPMTDIQFGIWGIIFAGFLVVAAGVTLYELTYTPPSTSTTVTVTIRNSSITTLRGYTICGTTVIGNPPDVFTFSLECPITSTTHTATCINSTEVITTTTTHKHVITTTISCVVSTTS